ncbi:AMP-dependent synthetase [Novosphingobium sp. AAP83]|nr:AMP-dependent synthetase [Novosphingobium sp. AAP83]
MPLSVIHGPPLAEEPGLGELTLSGWFRTICEQWCSNEALVHYEGGFAQGERVSWTYAEMWARSNEVARALVACGVGKGTRVGILMTNRPEFLAATFGTALAGGVATTLSTFSTAAELEHLLGASCISVLLMERQVLKKDFGALVCELDPALASASPGAITSTKYPFLTHIAAVGGGSGAIEDWSVFLARGASIAQACVDARALSNSPADPGVLFFSSGSTAMPKGILSAHRGVTLQLWRWPKWYDAKPGDLRMWSANGFFWSGNFSMALGGALTDGGCLILQTTFNAEEALQLMEAEKASFLNAWPHQWEQIIAAPNWAMTDLSSLTYIDYKSPIAQHPTIKSTWREPFAAFGNTETFTLFTVYPANTPDEVTAGSVGVPAHGVTVKIIDPLTGAIMPQGERGEICVKGPTLMLGYLGLPLTETLDAEGYLRTGDSGHFDAQGRMFWHGRLNDIIKTGGANVSPVEVDTLMRKMPQVKISQTVGVPHATLGELVVTCIVPHEGALLSEEDVKAFAKQSLASFKVPRSVLFFAEDELATTGTNKIKTADLRKLATERLA